MSEMADLEVIATRTEPCRHPEQTAEHHVKVKLRDGTVHDAAAVITAIETHEAHYVMIPPPGAPAYEAHAKTGLPLLLQVRECPYCKDKVLFA